jgi:hypothetical protein
MPSTPEDKEIPDTPCIKLCGRCFFPKRSTWTMQQSRGWRQKSTTTLVDQHPFPGYGPSPCQHACGNHSPKFPWGGGLMPL